VRRSIFSGWRFVAVPELKTEAPKVWPEARELHPIFAKIWRSGKGE